MPSNRRSLWALACSLFVVGLFVDGVASAAEAGSSAKSDMATAADDVTSKRAQLSERIAKLTAAMNSTTPQGESSSNSKLDEELDLLQSLDLVYLQQQSAAEELPLLDQEQKQIAQDTATLHEVGPAEPKPYSFLILDEARDELATEEERAELIAADLAAAEDLWKSARKDYENCERSRRLAREACQQNQDAGKQEALATALRLAELKSNLAQETMSARRGDVDVRKMRRTISEARRGFLQDKATAIAKDAHFTQRDFDTRVQRLTQAAAEYRLKLKDAEKRLLQSEAEGQRSLAQLQQQHAEATVQEEAAETYRLIRSAGGEEITLINQRLNELDHHKHFATCRFDLASGKLSADAMSEWRDELTDSVNSRKSLQKLRSLRLQELHVEQTALDRRARVDASQNGHLKPWLDRQTAQLKQLIELYESTQSQSQISLRSLERLLADLEAGSVKPGMADRLAATRATLAAFWNYELEKVDDRPITVGKIVSGIIYLAVGLALARLLSRIFGRQIVPRLGFNEGASHAIQAMTFYLLCVVFCLLAFDLVNLPFAAFTFLGGAVAIGVGFGSQNIVNNFISGLILLVEQPLRVGDQVDVSGKVGTVEKIGAQSTRLRTIANHEIVVPNSKLLEEQVTNYTLSDDLVRTSIRITLNPDLPVEEVRDRLLTAARHPQVLGEPAPVVLFLDFDQK
ncbi:MAG TPA: mechanosensitive ion channel domain-containing protein, partial [Pirellulales bacterium]|nr:mechanosensitive ion channel domain-containing protein [Pirellulales bacterium]